MLRRLTVSYDDTQRLLSILFSLDDRGGERGGGATK